MNDVAADADVARHRHSQSPAGRRDAQMPVRQRLFLDRAPHAFTQPFAAVGRRENDLVQAARLAPQPEFAAHDPFRHVFARATAGGQLVIVNDPRAVRRQMGHQPTFHQIDQIARKSQLDRVAAHHQHDRTAASARFDELSDELAKLRMRVLLEPR